MKKLIVAMALCVGAHTIWASEPPQQPTTNETAVSNPEHSSPTPNPDPVPNPNVAPVINNSENSTPQQPTTNETVVSNPEHSSPTPNPDPVPNPNAAPVINNSENSTPQQPIANAADNNNPVNPTPAVNPNPAPVPVANQAPILPPPVPAWLREAQQTPDIAGQLITLLETDKFDARRPKHMRMISKACEFLLCKNSQTHDQTLKKILDLCVLKKVEIKDVQLSEIIASHVFHTRALHEEDYKKQVENLNVGARNARANGIATIQNTIKGFKDGMQNNKNAYTAQWNMSFQRNKIILGLYTDLLALTAKTNPSFNPLYNIQDLLYEESAIENLLVGDSITNEKLEFQQLIDQHQKLCVEASLLGKKQ